MGTHSRVSSRTYRCIFSVMNAKIIKLEFETPFPDINHAKDALTVLSHTILFHRSTGNFQYREGSNSKFSIEPVGLIDDELNHIRLSNDINGNNINIRYPFIRMNCEQLDKYIKQEINNRIKNTDSNQFYLSFYQNSSEKAGFFKTESNFGRVWEQYHIYFEIEDKGELVEEFQSQLVCDNHEVDSDDEIYLDGNENSLNSAVSEKNQNEENYFSGVIGQQLAGLCNKVIREISVNQSYVPPLPQEKSQLGTVFSTKFKSCQPYLFKLASSKEELNSYMLDRESPMQAFGDIDNNKETLGNSPKHTTNLKRNESGRKSGGRNSNNPFDILNVTKKL